MKYSLSKHFSRFSRFNRQSFVDTLIQMITKLFRREHRFDEKREIPKRLNMCIRHDNTLPLAQRPENVTKY